MTQHDLDPGADVPEADRAEQQLGLDDEPDADEPVTDPDAPLDQADEGDRIEQARAVPEEDEGYGHDGPA